VVGLEAGGRVFEDGSRGLEDGGRVFEDGRRGLDDVGLLMEEREVRDPFEVG
jgi:hypothetical protein